MSHSSLIENTSYDITGGRTLISGTQYDILQGKILIDGTSQDILFSTTVWIYNLQAGTSAANWTCRYEQTLPQNPNQSTTGYTTVTVTSSGIQASYDYNVISMGPYAGMETYIYYDPETIINLTSARTMNIYVTSALDLTYGYYSRRLTTGLNSFDVSGLSGSQTFRFRGDGYIQQVYYTT